MYRATRHRVIVELPTPFFHNASTPLIFYNCKKCTMLVLLSKWARIESGFTESSAVSASR
ncbi:unnamed protein product [Leptidea sinapis]|uniref:Uncharacterized protein n=1 Tax=Leptidea sinapis TaxID=189913 RepID=A0A5E4QJP1_9NEOP|nr:unnamed protein product [Leptidea sinapis]